VPAFLFCEYGFSCLTRLQRNNATRKILTNATLRYLALHFGEIVSNCVVYAKEERNYDTIFIVAFVFLLQNITYYSTLKVKLVV
jgi:hypothetical protein